MGTDSLAPMRVKVVHSLISRSSSFSDVESVLIASSALPSAGVELKVRVYTITFEKWMRHEPLVEVSKDR